MSVYKMNTARGSYTIQEAAAVLCSKWIQQGLRNNGREDIMCLDDRPEVQRWIRDAIMVEVGRLMQKIGTDQEIQNKIFQEMLDGDSV